MLCPVPVICQKLQWRQLKSCFLGSTRGLTNICERACPLCIDCPAATSTPILCLQASIDAMQACANAEVAP
eukprot:812850-Amphidinium_carterae.1